MEVSHLRILFKKLNSLSPLLQSLRNFSSSSSSSSAAAASPRTWKFFSDDAAEGGSSVYRHTLKLQRPSSIRWRPELHNSVSFIGTVDRPPKQVDSVSKFGVYTLINVKTSRNSNKFFKILLNMWDEMAEIAIKHLKRNDSIYVSGHLESYTKVDENGKLMTHYKVNVKEINYIGQCGRGLDNKQSEQSDSGEAETGLDNYRKRLHLWQLFFANPSEWLDFRRRKQNPNQPDFKHKDTGEALWIGHRDPPWIRRQLQLHDSRLAAQGLREDVNPRSSLSPLVYDD